MTVRLAAIWASGARAPRTPPHHLALGLLISLATRARDSLCRLPDAFHRAACGPARAACVLSSLRDPAAPLGATGLRLVPRRYALRAPLGDLLTHTVEQGCLAGGHGDESTQVEPHQRNVASLADGDEANLL